MIKYQTDVEKRANADSTNPPNKWLSDEEINRAAYIVKECLPPVGNRKDVMAMFEQAKKANRLREDFKRTTAALYGATNELNRLRDELEEIAEQMRSDLTDMRSNSLGADPGEERAADLYEGFVERIRKLREGDNDE